jgi:hypothetical protein
LRLAKVPDYPAGLNINYSQQLNRWLPLVKWMLAFPQYVLAGALVGSGYSRAPCPLAHFRSG